MNYDKLNKIRYKKGLSIMTIHGHYAYFSGTRVPLNEMKDAMKVEFTNVNTLEKNNKLLPRNKKIEISFGGVYLHEWEPLTKAPTKQLIKNYIYEILDEY